MNSTESCLKKKYKMVNKNVGKCSCKEKHRLKLM